MEKIVGQLCPSCGGKYVKSPNTGKVFCENKCWLNQPQQSFKGQPTQAFKQQLVQEKQDEKWENIAERKVRHGFAIEAFKQGLELNVNTVAKIQSWVKFVMTNKLN
jgi:reverse gyrase